MDIQLTNILVWVPSVSALIALTALIYNYRRNPRKNLSYEVPVNYQLVDIDKSIKSRVKVLFDDVEVPDASIIHIKVVNTGNTSITEKDYTTPIEIRFGKDAQILQCTLSSTFPKGIPAEITNNETHLTFKPVMLNSEDFVLIRIYVARVSDITVTGRIEGVKLIGKRSLSDPGHPFHYRRRFLLLVLFLSSVLMTILNFTPLRRWMVVPIAIIGIIILGVMTDAGNFYGDQIEKWVVKKIKEIQQNPDK